MPGFSLTVYLEGAFQRIAHFFSALVGDDRAVIAEYGEQRMFQDSQQSFLQTADPTSGAEWVKRKREPKDGHPILRMSAAGLMKHVRAGHDETASGFEIWGGVIPLVYAAIHQFGGTEGMAPGPAAIPARPYVGLSPESVAKIAAFASAHARGDAT
jgi:phage virion morphogenesis protein